MRHIFILAACLPLAAQWLNHPTPGIPRTADGKPNLTAPTPRLPGGKPDLSGVWNIVNPVSDLKPDDVQPWAQALFDQRQEHLHKDRPSYSCLPEGPGQTSGMKKMVQTPEMLVILGETLDYRQIFMDGRALEIDPNPSWMGYSVGRWDGDTLVVESNGFNDRTWLDGFGYPHTEALRVTERYRRTDFGHLEVKVTFDDKRAYKRPWTVVFETALQADTELLEAVCNESHSGIEHWVGKESDAQRTAVKVAPEILAKYAGVYKGTWSRRVMTVEVTFSGDVLFIGWNGAPQGLAIARSETSFIAVGLAWDFVRDNQGDAVRVIMGAVSGDYPAERVK